MLPKANELFIDLDSDDAWETFKANYNLLHKLRLDGKGTPVSYYTSAPSRSKPEGRHVTVTCKRDLTPIERIAYQAVLGSDLRRELYSLWRIENGDAIPTLFYEKGAGVADMWHEGTKSFYRAGIIKKLTPEEAAGPEL